MNKVLVFSLVLASLVPNAVESTCLEIPLSGLPQNIRSGSSMRIKAFLSNTCNLPVVEEASLTCRYEDGRYFSLPMHIELVDGVARATATPSITSEVNQKFSCHIVFEQCGVRSLTCPKTATVLAPKPPAPPTPKVPSPEELKALAGSARSSPNNPILWGTLGTSLRQAGEEALAASAYSVAWLLDWNNPRWKQKAGTLTSPLPAITYAEITDDDWVGHLAQLAESHDVGIASELYDLARQFDPYDPRWRQKEEVPENRVASTAPTSSGNRTKRSGSSGKGALRLTGIALAGGVAASVLAEDERQGGREEEAESLDDVAQVAFGIAIVSFTISLIRGRLSRNNLAPSTPTHAALRNLSISPTRDGVAIYWRMTF